MWRYAPTVSSQGIREWSKERNTAKLALEEGSNSLSVKMPARIESVKSTTSGIATIAVSGGRFFSAPIEAFEEEGVDFTKLALALASSDKTLSIIDEEDLERFSSADEVWKAEKKALELCARAEQNANALCAKLLKRGFSRERASKTVKKLSRLGVVDDSRYARLWVSSNAARRGLGPRKVAYELRSALISGPCGRFHGSDEVDAIVASALEAVDFDEILKKEAKKAFRSALSARGLRAEPNVEPDNGMERETRALFVRRLLTQGFFEREIASAYKLLHDEWLENEFKCNT